MFTCILFCPSSASIWYATWPCLKKLFPPPPPGHPERPYDPPPGVWLRRQNENPVWYVLYLSFVRTRTNFGIKIFEIDYVIEIKRYFIFWPIHVSNSHNKFGWISSNGLGGDSITDRTMEGWRRLQYPLRFLKSVGIITSCKCCQRTLLADVDITLHRGAV